MICLDCGKRQKGEVGEPCRSCGRAFEPTPGIYGINNISQLLSAVDECREGRLSPDALKTTFDAFAEVWEGFSERWKLPDAPVPELFELSPVSEGVYKEPLTQFEEAFAHLDDAFAALDEMDGVDPALLDDLADDVRQFFRGVCSAAAITFKKLENPKGDFGALLSNFSF